MNAAQDKTDPGLESSAPLESESEGSLSFEQYVRLAFKQILRTQRDQGAKIDAMCALMMGVDREGNLTAKGGLGSAIHEMATAVTVIAGNTDTLGKEIAKELANGVLRSYQVEINDLKRRVQELERARYEVERARQQD